ncbi:MAG: phosphoglucosamine mutase [Candidatus Undinarchaeales archaeon]|jgi:phosphoglucosamine mutase|nr:phosphoglucosamine mutase [Candidatus Undinarchaeales archaeon]
MTKLFGSSGIRGIYGEKITPELMLSVGKALGNYLKTGKILLARDTRKTSKLLENSFAAGIESTGVEVSRTGVIPTPALAFATRKLGMQSSAIITASHNPPEYNGIKLWNSDSSAYTPEMEKEIEDIVGGAQGLGGAGAQWDEITQSNTINVKSDYINAVLEAVNLEKKHKIALDCGHGAACTISPELLARVGEVSKIFSDPDGEFPGRKSEPCEENLSELKKLVVETGSEVGFAHDGDADRLGVVDEKGNFVNKDKLLALIALNELEKKKGQIVVPVDTSLLVEETIKNAGGTVSMTPIGDVHVAVEMKKTNAVFGGEPSGCFIFPETHWCPDGLLASLKVLEIIEKNGALSEQIAKLPNYFTVREKIKCDDQEKTCTELYEKVRTLDGTTRVLEIDGLRADLQDAWVLVRPSGTEPIVRLTVEARDQERADELLSKIKS